MQGILLEERKAVLTARIRYLEATRPLSETAGRTPAGPAAPTAAGPLAALLEQISIPARRAFYSFLGLRATFEGAGVLVVTLPSPAGDDHPSSSSAPFVARFAPAPRAEPRLPWQLISHNLPDRLARVYLGNFLPVASNPRYSF
jgi:hypothetical protein